jgi:hypothetical protein
VFKNKEPRRIFGHTGDEIGEEERKYHNEYLHTVRFVKQTYYCCGKIKVDGINGTYSTRTTIEKIIFVGKPEGRPEQISIAVTFLT